MRPSKREVMPTPFNSSLRRFLSLVAVAALAVTVSAQERTYSPSDETAEMGPSSAAFGWPTRKPRMPRSIPRPWP